MLQIQKQAFSKERTKNTNFLFLNKTYVVGTQKNRLNEHPKHMLKLIGKKIFKILRSKILFI